MILNDNESEYALQLFSLRYSQLLDEISGLGSRSVPRCLLTEFHLCRGLRLKLISWKRSRVDV